MCDHVALALDGTLPQGCKVASLRLQPLHHSVTDVHAAWEAVALHAAGHVHGVSQETVPGALHADDAGICCSTMHTWTSHGMAAVTTHACWINTMTTSHRCFSDPQVAGKSMYREQLVLHRLSD